MTLPTTVRAAAPIPLPIEVCWEKFRDLTRAKDYVPGLTDSVITTEKKEGVGASRIVSHAQFGEMNETVLQWDEGIGMTIRLHKGDKSPTPMKSGIFRYEFKPAGDGTEIHTALTYEMPLGILGEILDSLVLRRIFQRNVGETAACLAENYRSDRPVPASEVAGLRSTLL